MSRIICWFSNGAASAYATYLAANKYGAENITAVCCHVEEEHYSNKNFRDQFELKTGIKVTVIKNEKYDGSIYNVFNSAKFIKGVKGAPCTSRLKKDLRKQYQKPGDIQIFGYTIEEQNRADRFIDANNEVEEDFILIDQEITKKDCIDWVEKTGLPVPIMYKLGYPNNNCIGCVKGGMGYWNAIRKDFPENFKRMAELERVIGHSVCKDKNGPVYLDELDPSRGNFERDVPGDCGFTCEAPEKNQ